jgi:hypothetical protein
MHIIVFLLALALGCPRASSSANAMPVDTPASERCVLSVVMVGRNDEWQAGGGLGNFTSRLAASVTAFILHAERLKLKCQVIVVDYNPPHDTLSLRRQFFRQATGVQGSAWRHSDLIFVTVPHTVHVQVKKITVWRAYDAKLFEYVAKNAGLRAARCKYVLVTNPDIVPGRATMDFLHSSLSHTAAERRGVSDDVNDLPLSLSLSDGKFVTMARTNARLPIPLHLVSAGDLAKMQDALAQDSPPPTHAPGDFLLASRARWFEIGGFPEIGSNAGGDDVACKLLNFSGTNATRPGAALILLKHPLVIYHQPHLGERGDAIRTA